MQPVFRGGDTSGPKPGQERVLAVAMLYIVACLVTMAVTVVSNKGILLIIAVVVLIRILQSCWMSQHRTVLSHCGLWSHY